MSAMIEVRKLVKSFGEHLVLREMDLEVAQGECLALVGPNGAGKTTLLRILNGMDSADGGTLSVLGQSVL
jgi:ABC-type multidrug transport system ATPase subunit